jgi:gliding motility-associated-like protein
MLTVSDGGVCDYTTTITIPNIPGAVAAFTANPEFAQPGIPINFTSSNTSASAWHWDFGNGSTFSGSPNATQSYVEQGVYTVHLTIVDNNGCVDSTTQIVTIVTVLIPNVITPNGDYENDYFVIKGLEDVPNKLVRIYNRWGRKVFESGDYQNNWNADGFDDGVYYYTLWVEVLKKEYHGSLTVFKQ